MGLIASFIDYCSEIKTYMYCLMEGWEEKLQIIKNMFAASWQRYIIVCYDS